jgi:hypothetical protein
VYYDRAAQAFISTTPAKAAPIDAHASGEISSPQQYYQQQVTVMQMVFQTPPSIDNST